MRSWPKRLFRRLKALFAPFLGWLLVTVLSKTLRITRINPEVLDEREKNGVPFIAAMWHGEQFLMYYLHRRMKIAILSSPSRDGDILAGILKRFGYEVVRGSSTRGGARALVKLMRKVREGCSAYFAVDGPQGPYHVVKPGVVYLAEKTGEVIIPVTARAEHYATFNRAWDKFMLPFPFSRAVVIYGDPLRVTGDLEGERQRLEERLTALSRRAEEFFCPARIRV